MSNSLSGVQWYACPVAPPIGKIPIREKPDWGKIRRHVETVHRGACGQSAPENLNSQIACHPGGEYLKRSSRINEYLAVTWVLLVGTGVLLVIDLQYRKPGIGVALGLMFIGVLAGFSVLVHESRVVRQLEYGRFRELFTLLSDGVIVMDPNRSIVYTNPAAVRMTGWYLGDVVPYCKYCQTRRLKQGEQRCLLAESQDRNYFESQLLTRSGDFVNVGMSRTFLMPHRESKGRDMVITIRDVTLELQEEELRLTRRLTHHTWEVQEEERKRLSQELHDGVSQSLYAVNLGLDYLTKQVSEPQLRSKIEELKAQMNSSIDEIRTLSRTVYPAVLYSLGLVAALQTFAETLTTPELTVSYVTNMPFDSKFPAEVAVHIYRIAQEATHNAILHGRATLVHIELMRTQGAVSLDIRDNGTGFHRTDLDSAGYGLRNMEERARVIGSAISIDSTKGTGTWIHLSIPLAFDGTHTE